MNPVPFPNYSMKICQAYGLQILFQTHKHNDQENEDGKYQPREAQQQRKLVLDFLIT